MIFYFILTAVNAFLVSRLVVSVILPSISVIFVLKFVFVTKLLTLRNLFSTVVSSAFVAKLLILVL